MNTQQANTLELQSESFLALVRQALAEDIGSGDVTTEATVPGDHVLSASLAAREHLVVAGLPLAEAAFAEVCPAIQRRPMVKEGHSANPGDCLMKLHGPAWGILTAERVALNFLQRLSGVATMTARFVDAIRGTQARILDTRKTTPGWRVLEKYAVRCGGGQNHRTGLFDLVLIKDNHLAALSDQTEDPVGEAVRRARARYPNLEIEVEADRLDQVQQAIAAGADIILLDNMPPETLRAAISMVGGQCRTEASGGVSLATVRALAETGVDFISVGALTHSAVAVDIGLDIEPAQPQPTAL